MPTPTTADLLARIQQYLEVGGLWNPEMMEHDKVRTLIIDLQNHLINMETARRWKEYETLNHPVDEFPQRF